MSYQCKICSPITVFASQKELNTHRRSHPWAEVSLRMQGLEIQVMSAQAELSVLQDVGSRDRYGDEYTKYYDMRAEEVRVEYLKAKKHAETLHSIAVDVKRFQHWNPHCKCTLTVSCDSCKEYD